VLIVGDLHTGEQVFEFASQSTRIPEMAKLAYALGRFFWNAVINWDATGSLGITFGQILVDDLGYENYMTCEVEKGGSDRKPGTRYGTIMNDESKPAMLEMTMQDVANGEFIIRSEYTLREAGEFGWKDDKIVHIRARKQADSQTKGKSHGDRFTAAAMANLVRREYGPGLDPIPEKPPGPNDPLQEVPWDCRANRMIAHNRRQALHARPTRWF
jgi:hypothetical protein